MKKSMKIGQKVYAVFPRFIDPIVRNDNAPFPCFPVKIPYVRRISRINPLFRSTNVSTNISRVDKNGAESIRFARR